MKAFDFQETYLRSVLGFIGITEVQAVRVEGVAMGADALTSAMSSASAQAGEAVRSIA
jgi:FMN-dependent NADH-azoreductase